MKQHNEGLVTKTAFRTNQPAGQKIILPLQELWDVKKQETFNEYVEMKRGVNGWIFDMFK